MNHFWPRKLAPVSKTIAIAIILAVSSLSHPAVAISAEEQAEDANRPDYQHAVLIRFEGFINSVLEQYVYRKLKDAREDGADLIIIEIDSGGGEVDASFDLAEHLSRIDWAHTVAFVPRGANAYSGAAVVALGCDEIVIAPQSQMGDVGMIFVDESEGAFRYAPEKELSPFVSRIRALAEKKGRPPALAEAMMRHDYKVFQYTHPDHANPRFMSTADAEATDDKKWKKGKLIVETRDRNFLTVNGERGSELQISQETAIDRDDIARKYNVEGRLLVVEQTSVDWLVFFLNLPFITGVLIVLGMIFLYVEFSSPGIGIGGLLAGLCFLLFFWSRFLGGTAGVLEVLLFFVGVAFIAIELFVIPGFGLPGLTGILLVLGSLVMASQTFIIPRTPAQTERLVETLSITMGSCVVAIGGIILLSRYLGSLPLFNRLRLEPPTEQDSSERQGPSTQKGPGAIQIGSTGIAATQLRPSGKMQIGDLRYDVTTDNEFIDSGSQLEVVRIRGTLIEVRQVD